MVLNFTDLIKKHSLVVKGVLHIGGHRGTEIQSYLDNKIENVLLFEPLSNNFQFLSEKIKNTNYNAMQIALGNFNGNMEMFVEDANSSMSSSLLKPKLHLKQYPHIVFTRKEDVSVKKLDDVEFNRDDYNMINIDVQGYELEVFKGSIKTLKHIDIIYTEINKAELYENCVQIDELDSFLSEHNFKRFDTDWIGGTWGDALYIKQDLKESK